MANTDNVFGTPVVTPRGRFFFADVDTPNTQSKNPKNLYPSERFDVTMGFQKDADLTALKAECVKVATAAFKTSEGIEMPFANGDEKSLDSMKGQIIIRAKSQKRPGLVDGKKGRITEADIVMGMWGRIQITPFSYQSGKTKGVTFNLKNVQVFTDSPFEPIGGGQSAESVFDDVEEDGSIGAF